MVIISGTRAAQKRIGCVADYCVNCMEVRAFDLLAHGIGRHSYYVSTGLSETQGHRMKCRTCHLATSTTLARYQKVAPRPHDHDLNLLIQQTFPDLHTALAQLIQGGDQMKARFMQMPPQVRQDFMVTVLERFNPMVEHRYANWSDFDKYSGGGCLTTILLVIFCINRSCANMSPEGSFTNWLRPVPYIVGIGLIVTVVLAILGPSRFMKAEIIPGVAIGLRHLKPTDEEITAVLERTRGLKLKIGRKISPHALVESLREGKCA